MTEQSSIHRHDARTTTTFISSPPSPFIILSPLHNQSTEVHVFVQYVLLLMYTTYPSPSHQPDKNPCFKPCSPLWLGLAQLCTLMTKTWFWLASIQGHS